MSIQAMAWVIDHSQATGSDYAVLLMLANHYNHETGQCNPGYRRIASEARVSRSTVGRSVERLCELGELAITTTGEGRRTTKYHFPWLSTSDQEDMRSVSLWDASDSVASHEGPLASHATPRSVSPGRDRSLKQNLEPRGHDDETPHGVVVSALRPPQVVTLSDGSRWLPDTGELVDPVTDVDDELASRRRHPTGAETA